MPFSPCRYADAAAMILRLIIFDTAMLLLTLFALLMPLLPIY